MNRQGELERYLQYQLSRRALEGPGDARGKLASLASMLECDAAINPAPSRWRRQYEVSLTSGALAAEDMDAALERRRSLAARVLAKSVADPTIVAREARVRTLERTPESLLAQLLPERTSSDQDDAPVEPHVAWIEAHRDVLRAHPDSFVALDPEKGILVHATDGDDFAAQLGKLSPEERDRVVLFHTSMYV